MTHFGKLLVAALGALSPVAAGSANPSLDGTFAWFAMSNPRGHDEDDD